MEYGQVLRLAFIINVESTNDASRVFLPRLKPNCSSPRSPLDSAQSVMMVHILTVIIRRMLDGIVIGRYWTGSRESPT